MVRYIGVKSHDTTSIAYHTSDVGAAVAFDTIGCVRRITSARTFVFGRSHCLSNLYFTLKSGTGCSDISTKDERIGVDVEMAIVEFEFGKSLNARL